jgi:hypothetical protein
MSKKIRKEYEGKFYQRYRLNNYIGSTIDDRFIDDLCDELIKYAHNSDGRRGFYCLLDELGIPGPTFEFWVKKYEHLRDTYAFAKKIFAEHLLESGLVRKFEPSLVRVSLVKHDKDYSMAQETDNRTRVVVLEDYGRREKDQSK